jgi:hypothetical protein
VVSFQGLVIGRKDQEMHLLNNDEYDDSPWSREELQALAWEAGKQASWEDMDEYDDLPEEP